MDKRKDFFKSNLEKEELEVIEKVMKDSGKLFKLLIKLNKNKIPIEDNKHYLDEKELKKINSKMEIMNKYLNKRKFNILQSKENDGNELNYLILPKVVIKIDNDNNREIIILKLLYNFNEDNDGKCIRKAHVLIDKVILLDSRNWINDYFKDFNIAKTEYDIVISAIKKYIDGNEVKKISVPDFQEFINLNNLENKLPELGSLESWNKEIKLRNATYKSLQNLFLKGDQKPLSCFVSFLTLSFINGMLVKEKIAPNFVLLLNGEKDADIMDYFLSNPFSEGKIKLNSASGNSNYAKKGNIENKNKSQYNLRNYSNNVLIFDYIDKEGYEELEENLFKHYRTRNEKNKNKYQKLYANIVVNTEPKTNKIFYYRLNVKEEINIDILPQKEEYLLMLAYLIMYIEDNNKTINKSLTKKYNKFKERFENYHLNNDAESIHQITILMVGFNIYLEYGRYINIICEEEKIKYLQEFEEWLIDYKYEESGVEEDDFNPLSALKTLLEAYDNNKQQFLEYGKEPNNNDYLGWHRNSIDTSSLENVDKRDKEKQVIYVEENFIKKLKNRNENDEFDDIKKYLLKNKLVFKYGSGGLLKKQNVHENYDGKVMILSIYNIRNHIKELSGK